MALPVMFLGLSGKRGVILRSICWIQAEATQQNILTKVILSRTGISQTLSWTSRCRGCWWK